jgi:hypothetical protein
VPILFYRSRPEPGRESWRVNYVHPLHAVNGITLTEDAPSDHPHQRGVYWAWRRILVDGVRVADGWVGDRIVLDVGPPRHRSHRDGSSEVMTSAVWRVPLGGVEVPVIEEAASIRAFPVHGGRRRIDFEIRLRALRSGVQLAGTDDDKGYGGFSLRLAHADTLGFADRERRIEPAVGAVEAGATVDLLWGDRPRPDWPMHVQVGCSVDGEPWLRWVLRRELSMQNCAFPGREPVPVPQHQPIVIGATVVL